MTEQRSWSVMAAATILVLPAILFSLPLGTVQAASGNPWYLTTMAVERQAIYDMVIGEVDPTSPGPELVVTGGGGIVNQYSSDSFAVKPIFTALITQQGVAIGDILPQYEGNEIISVGMDQKVHVIHREASGSWTAETVWQSLGKVNGVTVGEFNSSHAGKEIAVAGDEAILAIINPDKNFPNGWSVRVLTVQEIPITNMLCYSADILPDSPGDEILVGSFSGDAFLARWDTLTNDWNVTSIYRDAFAILGFGFGQDIMTDVPGPEIYVAGFSGNVSVLTFNGTKWQQRTIMHDKDPIYTVLPCDFDPRYPGPELIVSGIGYYLHLLRYDNGTWYEEVIKDPTGNRLRLLYDMEYTEFNNTHLGPELIMGGVDQELLMIRYIPPAFELKPILPAQTVVSGRSADIWFSVDAMGYFSGTIELSTSPGAILSKTSASPGDLVMVNYPTPTSSMDKTYSIVVTGTSLVLDLVRTITLTVNAKSSDSKGFELALLPEEQITIPGFETTFMVQTKLVNSWTPQFTFSVDQGLPFASTVDWDPYEPTPTCQVTITPGSTAASGAYHFVVRAKAVQGTAIYETTAVATIKIDATGGNDFTMTTTTAKVTGVPVSTVRFDLSLNPLGEFTEPVALTVGGLPSGSHGSFSAMLTPVPAKVTFELYLGTAATNATCILTFTASGGGKVHKALARLDVVSKTKYGDYGLTVIPGTQMVRPGGTTYFLIRTTGNFFPYELNVEPKGPYQAVIRPGTDGNPDFKVMTVTISKNAALGIYKGTVVGKAPWEHNVSFTIIVSSDFPDIELAMDPGELLVSPGQKEVVFRLNASKGGDLLVGHPLSYNISGIGDITWGFWTNNFTYDNDIPFQSGILQDNSPLAPGTYTLLMMVTIPDFTYKKAVLVTLVATPPAALLSIKTVNAWGAPREGAKWQTQAYAINDGPRSSDPSRIEVLIDGKSLCTKAIGPIPAGGKSPYINCTWDAQAGEHSIVYIVQTENETQTTRVLNGVIMDKYSAYSYNTNGPIIALVLLLLVVGLAKGMSTTRTAPKPPAGKRTRPIQKGSEEE